MEKLQPDVDVRTHVDKQPDVDIMPTQPSEELSYADTQSHVAVDWFLSPHKPPMATHIPTAVIIQIICLNNYRLYHKFCCFNNLVLECYVIIVIITTHTQCVWSYCLCFIFNNNGSIYSHLSMMLITIHACVCIQCFTLTSHLVIYTYAKIERCRLPTEAVCLHHLSPFIQCGVQLVATLAWAQLPLSNS